MESPRPKISVVVPVYNGAKHIETCVETLQNQSYSAYEIVLVNDASTDNTVEVVQKLLLTCDV